MQSTTSNFPGPVELLRLAWADYQAHAKLYSGIFVIPLAFSLVVSFLPQVTALDPGHPAFFTLNILSGIVATLGVIALLLALDKPETTTLADAYRESTRRFFPYVWVMIVSGFIVGGLLVLLLIPGIIASVWFTLAFLVFVAEDAHGMQALLRSKAYVAGHWWGVFGRSLFMGLFAAGAFGVATLVSGMVAWSAAGGTPQIFSLVSGAIGGLISVVLTPVTYSFLFHMYRSLRQEKGVVVIDETSGYKARFLVPALIGVLLVPLLIGTLALWAARNGIMPRTSPWWPEQLRPTGLEGVPMKPPAKN